MKWQETVVFKRVVIRREMQNAIFFAFLIHSNIFKNNNLKRYFDFHLTCFETSTGEKQTKMFPWVKNLRSSCNWKPFDSGYIIA